MARLQAVIFDLWNTLIADPPDTIDRRDEIRLAGLSRVLEVHGLPHRAEAVSDACRAMREEMAARHARGRDLSLEKRVTFLLSKLSPSGSVSPALLAEAMDVFVEAARTLLPSACPGALDGLRAVRGSGLRIGLISNTGQTPGRGLRPVLEAHGFLPHFDALTFSDEVGLAKPAPSIYRRTLAALGVRPSATAFVGDDPELDVAGPLRLGMWTVQVGERESDGVRPHARIGRLDELAEALKSLRLLDGS